MKSTFKLSQFTQLICFLSGAILLLSSAAQAQVDFREPFRDVMSFQRAGINDAVGEVACEHGQPQLQNAVLLEDPAARPQYIYGDDGSKTCIAGSCLKKAETGQTSKRCESKRTDVKWFGDRDVRNDADAFVTEKAEKERFSGVGQIKCRGMKEAPGAPGVLREVEFKVTAFHVGSFDTVVTNAHAFVEDRMNPVTKEIEETKLSPDKCWAVFYDMAGREERISIAFVESRWDKPGLLGDKSQDIAIVKLSKESTVPSTALRYEYNVGTSVINGLSASMIGYHYDVQRPSEKRKTLGKIYSAPSDFYSASSAKKAGRPFTNIRNVFVGDYPSNHGSSGSPILNSAGAVIGIHQGQVDKEGDRVFNAKNNYNMGIFFDAQFDKDLQRIKAYRPSI